VLAPPKDDVIGGIGRSDVEFPVKIKLRAGKHLNRANKESREQERSFGENEAE
jgi:hypothetical protein